MRQRVNDKRGKQVFMMDVADKLDRQYGSWRKLITGRKRSRSY